MDRISRLNRRTPASKLDGKADVERERTDAEQQAASSDPATTAADAKADAIGTAGDETAAPTDGPVRVADPISERFSGLERDPVTKIPDVPTSGPATTSDDDSPGALLDRALDERTERDPTAFDDPRASLRGEAATALGDLANRDVQGIAPFMGDSSLVSAEGDGWFTTWLRGMSGQTTGHAEVTPSGEVKQTVQVPDDVRAKYEKASKAFTPNIDAADELIAEAEGRTTPPPAKDDAVVDPTGVASFEIRSSGTTKTVYNDGSVRLVRPDGIEVVHDTNGTTTVTDTRTGTTTTAPTPGGGVRLPDEEQRHQLSPEKQAIIDGVAERLAPKVGGDGHTDPVETDEPPVGSGSGNPTDTQDTLRGGDGRADDVTESGGANSGTDFDGTAGAINFGPDADGVDIDAREVDPFDQMRPNLGNDVQLKAPAPLIDPALLEVAREPLVRDAVLRRIDRIDGVQSGLTGPSPTQPVVDAAPQPTETIDDVEADHDHTTDDEASTGRTDEPVLPDETDDPLGSDEADDLDP